VSRKLILSLAHKSSSLKNCHANCTALNFGFDNAEIYVVTDLYTGGSTTNAATERENLVSYQITPKSRQETESSDRAKSP